MLFRSGFFVSNLKPGPECIVTVKLKKGGKVKFVVLTEDESDYIWKGNVGGRDIVALTHSTVLFDKDKATITGEDVNQEVLVYQDGAFSLQSFNGVPLEKTTMFKQLPPLSEAYYIAPQTGNIVECTFDGTSLAEIERLYVRCKSNSILSCMINGKKVHLKSLGDYLFGEDKTVYVNGKNNVAFILENPQDAVIGEIEVLLTNGTRWIWSTNNVWQTASSKQPVDVVENINKPLTYAPDESLAVYEVNSPSTLSTNGETRFYITYKGNIANAYIGSDLVHDHYFDGQDWILSASRLKEKLATTPLTIRIDGLRPHDNNIYFEKSVSLEGCEQPSINAIETKPEYVYELKLKK